MLHFDSDYMETGHPAIIKRFAELGLKQSCGYGFDEITLGAAKKIAEACGKPDALVKFLVGGTQANATVIDALLKNYEGVIALDSGHVSGHEAGAIEASGHKVLNLRGENGKITESGLQAFLNDFFADENWEHTVIPGMVYVSHPTERGTLYTKAELTALRKICDQYHLYLYLDGARLGYGLTADGTDLTLSDIADLCDAFYIGGTKVGAMCGEAVVFPNPDLVGYFMTHIKQHGALMAKGWILGAQFDVLFENDLYYRIARHANEMAYLIRDELKAKGYRFFIDSPTNQQFIVIDKKQEEELKKHTTYGFWCKYDDEHTVIRFATSWATQEENVKKLLRIL